MKRLLTLMVFWCAIAVSAPITAQMLAADDKDNSPAPAVLGPEDSGWYTRGDEGNERNQCNVLVDAITIDNVCVYRLSAMCVQDGEGTVVAISQQDAPHKAPIRLALYTPPSFEPAGYLEIEGLGAQPFIGLNEGARQWLRAAAYKGQWCSAGARGR